MSKLKEAEYKLRKYMISAVMLKHEFSIRKSAIELQVTEQSLNENIRRLGLTPSEIRRHASFMGDAAKPVQRAGHVEQRSA